MSATDKNIEKDEDKHQPVTDRARAEVMRFGIKPENEQQSRTFSHITPGSVYPLAIITPIYDRIHQLLKAKMTLNEETNEIEFTIEPKEINPHTRAIVDDILHLGPAAGGQRVKEAYEMISKMNRPAFNPMSMMGGMFGDKNEQVLTEEVPENE